MAPDATPDVTPDTSPTCTPGVLRCDKQTIQACVVGGIWQSITTCPASQPCVDGACCTPNCSGKDCGSDGCGGSCGACSTGLTCVGGECACIGSCVGKTCGDDGCGNACGACAATEACVDFACQCKPVCAGKTCGPDGCGGSCGTCKVGEQCTTGKCVCTPNCSGKSCGPDGCGGSCGTCPGKQDSCEAGVCECIPLCAANGCGTDGCGGSCGTCKADEICSNGACVPEAALSAVATFKPGDTPASLGWTIDGNVSVANSLPGINPLTGGAMLVVSNAQPTGSPKLSSSATLSATLPKGATRIVFSVRFISAELDVWCGTQFVDQWSFEVDGGTVDRAIPISIDDLCPPPAMSQACALSPPPCDSTCLDTGTACDWSPASKTCTGTYTCVTGRFVQALTVSQFEPDDNDSMMTDWVDVAIELTAPLAANQPVTVTIRVANVGDNAFDSVVLIDQIRTE